MSYEIITVITILHKKLSTREIKYFAQNPQQCVQNQDLDWFTDSYFVHAHINSYSASLSVPLWERGKVLWRGPVPERMQFFTYLRRTEPMTVAKSWRSLPFIAWLHSHQSLFVTQTAAPDTALAPPQIFCSPKAALCPFLWLSSSLHRLLWCFFEAEVVLPCRV